MALHSKVLIRVPLLTLPQHNLTAVTQHKLPVSLLINRHPLMARNRHTALLQRAAIRIPPFRPVTWPTVMADTANHPPQRPQLLQRVTEPRQPAMALQLRLTELRPPTRHHRLTANSLTPATTRMPSRQRSQVQLPLTAKAPRTTRTIQAARLPRATSRKRPLLHQHAAQHRSCQAASSR